MDVSILGECKQLDRTSKVVQLKKPSSTTFSKLKFTLLHHHLGFIWPCFTSKFMVCHYDSHQLHDQPNSWNFVFFFNMWMFLITLFSFVDIWHFDLFFYILIFHTLYFIMSMLGIWMENWLKEIKSSPCDYLCGVVLKLFVAKKITYPYMIYVNIQNEGTCLPFYLVENDITCPWPICSICK